MATYKPRDKGNSKKTLNSNFIMSYLESIIIKNSESI